MKIGWSSRNITPSVPMNLVGFTPSREGNSVHSSLFAKALILDDGGTLTGFIVTDLLGNTEALREAILYEIASHNLNINELALFSTHTHSGPQVLNENQLELPEYESETDYFYFLVDQCVDALIESYQSRDQFTYGYAKGTMQDFQLNRTDSQRPCDQEIGVILIKTRRKSALLYSFGGHPTILTRSSKRFSSDYVGVVEQVLKHHYDFTMFFNANCGDMSTRFTRKDNSDKELERLGNLAGNQVLDLAKRVVPNKNLTTFLFKPFTTEIQAKHLDSESEALQKLEAARKHLESYTGQDPLEKRLLESKVEGYLIHSLLAKRAQGIDRYAYDYALIKWDEALIVCMSGEVFTSLTLPYKKNTMWNLSLYNQYRSYLTTQNAYDEGLYEAVSSVYRKGEGERIYQEILRKVEIL